MTHAQRLLDLIRDAGPAGISAADLTEKLYEDDIDGGPLTARQCVHVHLCQLRKVAPIERTIRFRMKPRRAKNG